MIRGKGKRKVKNDFTEPLRVEKSDFDDSFTFQRFWIFWEIFFLIFSIENLSKKNYLEYFFIWNRGAEPQV